MRDVPRTIGKGGICRCDSCPINFYNEQQITGPMTMSEQTQSIDGTDFELCEFEDQCESCLHYGLIYFGNKDYWDSREGHYHCEECVRGMVADPEMFAYDDDETDE